MLGLPLAFAVPFALVALAGLPVLYVLLRVTPPRPERVPFPPLKLILDLKPKDETPASTPWWLLLLRLVLATLIILAMAGPIWNPIGAGDKGKGPLVVALDDGWAAAPAWDRRMVAAGQRIEAARQAGRPVAVVTVSDGGKTVIPLDAAAASERLRAIRPQPIEPDRAAAGAAIKAFADKTPGTSIVWIADGLERGGARAFGETLAALPTEITLLSDDTPVKALVDPRNDAGSLAVRVMRSRPAAEDRGRVRALDLKGLTIGEAPYTLPAGTSEADAHFDLPGELRNDIARLELVGGHSAGAVTLLDSRWKRRSVGIVSGDTADTDQPLLAPGYYLTKALSPFADVHEPKPGAPEPIGAMLDDRVNVLVLADVGTITGPIRDRLTQWVDGGGLLVRFAGTRLSGSRDELVPVKLRLGGRVLGGSLSWEQPKTLAPFEPPSPFVGLKVPKEVTVTRQVLAEPEPGLSAKTWAQLSDGTPLVTAASRGKGRVVLFHVTADTTWSNLPISGLFVDMLKKIVTLSGETSRAVVETEARANEQQAATASRQVETAAPSRTLDGFGALGSPPPTAKPVPVNFAGAATADHPPGFYGPADSLLAVDTLLPTPGSPPPTSSASSSAPLRCRRPNRSISGPGWWPEPSCCSCWTASATLWLAGKLGGRIGRRAVAASLALALGLGFAALPESRPAFAAGPDMSVPAKPQPPIKISPSDLASALSVRLAYVISGDAKVDETSKQGLTSLSTTLSARTSLDPGDPIGIDPARDELAFYPVIYWPIVASNQQPSQKAVEKIASYMRGGGTVVFDTRDALVARPGAEPTPAAAWLRQLLGGVDVPELEPIPADHVVTKTFYLIDNFIGRYASGQTWIEALPPPIGDNQRHPARSGDGVSPIVLTATISLPAGPGTNTAKRSIRWCPATSASTNWPCAAHQPRDVHANRQLQGRPGACARPAGAAWPLIGYGECGAREEMSDCRGRRKGDGTRRRLGVGRTCGYGLAISGRMKTSRCLITVDRLACGGMPIASTRWLRLVRTYILVMTDLPDDQRRFDIRALAADLPAHAETMLADIYLTDRPSSSARIFRVYRPVPAHFHKTCDEYLYVVSGRGAFWIGDVADEKDFAPGELICFDRETVHSISQLHEEPVVFMSIDAPRRQPTDITFVDPQAGSAATFMARNAKI